MSWRVFGVYCILIFGSLLGLAVPYAPAKEKTPGLWQKDTSDVSGRKIFGRSLHQANPQISLAQFQSWRDRHPRLFEKHE